jgi:hypothetical protein
VSQHADEPIDHDPLFGFANEADTIAQLPPSAPGSTQDAANVDVAPAEEPPQSAPAWVAALTTRLDRLEQAQERSLGQHALLRAEVATLVASIEDIKTRELRRARYAARLTPAVTAARGRTAPAIIGVLAGVTIGMVGWMTWQAESIAVADAARATVVVAAPAPIDHVAAAPAEPVVALASTTVVEPQTREAPAPAIDNPAGEIVDARRAETPYVGTLSIDASPGGTVFINRKLAGQTPLRVGDLKAGSHLVWIEREGYRRFTRVVQVPADRVSRLYADLEPLTP